MLALHNKINKYIIASAVILTTVWACEDVFEKDITDVQIQLISPSDSVVSTVNYQTFWWSEYEEDTLIYQLQIVSPNFKNPEALLLDTLTHQTQYQFELGAGTYQWRVRGLNGAYETDYVTRTFTITDSATVTDAVVSVVGPMDNLSTRSDAFNFEWEIMDDALLYRLVIMDNAWQSGDTILDTLTQLTALSIDLEDGAYGWGIQAIQIGSNSSSSTKFTTRNILIDDILPVTPIALNPGENDTIKAFPATFSWTAITDKGSDITDSLEVSQTNSFDDLWGSYATGNFAQNIDTIPNGNYYYRLYRVDAAGNKSEFSDTINFLVLK